MSYTPGCWFAQNVIGSGSCDGRLRKVHLIPAALIRREGFGHLVWDERVWRPGCGGPTGIGGHHGALDHARTLRIPRESLPASVEEFAAELDAELDGRFPFDAFLTREYGPKVDYLDGAFY